MTAWKAQNYCRHNRPRQRNSALPPPNCHKSVIGHAVSRESVYKIYKQPSRVYSCGEVEFSSGGACSACRRRQQAEPVNSERPAAVTLSSSADGTRPKRPRRPASGHPAWVIPSNPAWHPPDRGRCAGGVEHIQMAPPPAFSSLAPGRRHSSVLLARPGLRGGAANQ